MKATSFHFGAQLAEKGLLPAEVSFALRLSEDREIGIYLPLGEDRVEVLRSRPSLVETMIRLEPMRTLEGMGGFSQKRGRKTLMDE